MVVKWVCSTVNNQQKLLWLSTWYWDRSLKELKSWNRVYKIAQYLAINKWKYGFFLLPFSFIKMLKDFCGMTNWSFTKEEEFGLGFED